jgi:hypothetical protein
MKQMIPRRGGRRLNAQVLSRTLRRRSFYSIEKAGLKAGLTRTRSYEAARTGIIPTERYGRRLLVRRRVWDRRIRELLRGSKLSRRRTSEGKRLRCRRKLVSEQVGRRACRKPVKLPLPSRKKTRRPRPGARRDRPAKPVKRKNGVLTNHARM